MTIRLFGVVMANYNLVLQKQNKTRVCLLSRLHLKVQTKLKQQRVEVFTDPRSHADVLKPSIVIK